MTFLYPWMLGAPLLLLLYFFLRPVPAAIPVPSSELVDHAPKTFRAVMRRPVLGLLVLTAVLCLTVAAARPQRIAIYEQPRQARNIMLVVDVSKSMSARDFPTGLGYVTRMQGLKSTVAEFVKNRSNDRVGLVVFGQTSFLQSPLTSDTQLVEQLVRRLEPGMAGDGTAIGDGLGLALKRLKEIPGTSKAIILMTDGANNAGEVNPIKAAKIAHDLGVKIHSIGIGTGEPRAQMPGFGGIFDFPFGQGMEFDEETLKAIASASGGVYFNARSLEQFQDVYREIERLSETEGQDSARQVANELWFPFGIAGFMSLALLIFLKATYFETYP